MNKRADHPCFSREAHLKYARVHLPVAPMCNIQCNYCRRDFDCANESRPGVVSERLTPDEARECIDISLSQLTGGGPAVELVLVELGQNVKLGAGVAAASQVLAGPRPLGGKACRESSY